jgi:hypothetical protein
MENEESANKSTNWGCPFCGVTITVHVVLKEPPMCYNRASHSSKGIEMHLLDANDSKEKG